MTWTYADAKKRHEARVARHVGDYALRTGRSPSGLPEDINDTNELIDLVEKLGEALGQVKFARNGYCPICDGWMVSPNGATPGVHTEDCILAAALKELT